MWKLRRTSNSHMGEKSEFPIFPSRTGEGEDLEPDDPGYFGPGSTARSSDSA